MFVFKERGVTVILFLGFIALCVGGFVIFVCNINYDGCRLSRESE